MISLGVDFLPYERIVDDAARFLRESGYKDAFQVSTEVMIRRIGRDDLTQFVP